MLEKLQVMELVPAMLWDHCSLNLSVVHEKMSSSLFV